MEIQSYVAMEIKCYIGTTIIHVVKDLYTEKFMHTTRKFTARSTYLMDVYFVNKIM